MMALTCRELTELATDKKEGVLTLLQRAGVRVHLSWCGRCRRYLEQMDLAVDALAAMPVEAVPEDVEAALLEKFGERFRTRKKPESG